MRKRRNHDAGFKARVELRTGRVIGTPLTVERALGRVLRRNGHADTGRGVRLCK